MAGVMFNSVVGGCLQKVIQMDGVCIFRQNIAVLEVLFFKRYHLVTFKIGVAKPLPKPCAIAHGYPMAFAKSSDQASYAARYSPTLPTAGSYRPVTRTFAIAASMLG